MKYHIYCILKYSIFYVLFSHINHTNCIVPLARLQMSNTFYEAAGQNWFTLDSVHIHYNWTQEATFNASEVYAPATSSYHCQHVSSLHKYDTLLVPSSHTDTSANWHITFTDFQVHCSSQGLYLLLSKSSSNVCTFTVISQYVPFVCMSLYVCQTFFSFVHHLFGCLSSSLFVYRLLVWQSVSLSVHCLF